MTIKTEEFAIGQRIRITNGHPFAPTGSTGTLVQSYGTPYGKAVPGSALDSTGSYWVVLDEAPFKQAQGIPAAINIGRFEPLKEDTTA